MSSVVIDWVNQIGLAEGSPSLLTFYDLKSDTVGDCDNMVSGE